jgi:hypothetical protein
MRAPEFVAVLTLGAGVALLVAPRPVATAMRLGDRPGAARLVGIMDLALVPGLLMGRPRWPWMVARAAFNLPRAAMFRAEACRPGDQPAARVGMFAMLGISAVDFTTALALRAAERTT